MKKRGQANILTTVLIIGITIVAFFLVFNIVRPLVSEKSSEIPSIIEKLQTSDLKVNGFIENYSAGTLSVAVSNWNRRATNLCAVCYNNTK